MAKLVSIKDLSSFQLSIFGCETVFEATCKDMKNCTNFKFDQFKKLTQQTIPIRIDGLAVGQT